jgi:hypothetical protein
MEILLTPKDVKVIILSLQDTALTMTLALNDPEFNAHAKVIQKDILESANTCIEKLTKASGFACVARPYEPGDEAEFITKQS